MSNVGNQPLVSREEAIKTLKAQFENGVGKQVSIDGYCYVVERLSWPFINLRRAFPEPGSEPESRKIMKAGDKISFSGVKFNVMSAVGKAYFRIAPVNHQAFK